jgi:hypothetical protein
MLDEVNLFYQLLNHYCISWAFNDESGKGKIDYFSIPTVSAHLRATNDRPM